MQHLHPMHLFKTTLAALALLIATGFASAEEGPAWVATWTASPQPVWGEDFAFPTNIPDTLADRTFRQVVRISLGGERLRLVLSNAYAESPLYVGAVRVALAGEGGATAPASTRTVTFGGEATATLPPGAPLVSDPVDLPTDDLARLAVSVYLPGPAAPGGFHWDGRQTMWVAEGNRVDDETLPAAETTTARLFLTGVQVDAAETDGAVAVIGDSITDGNGATVDADTRWPDHLATRLAPHDVAVINAGISGARLLSDRMGVNALARFDRDVLAQPGVDTVVVLLGINDISWPGTAFAPQAERPTAQALIAGYRQLIARAKTQGVRIVGVTLTPFEGALAGTPLDDYHHPDKDALRREVNAWIRNSGAFDAVLDFDAWSRDPDASDRFAPVYDSGDHLHPGDEGNKRLAEAIDLNVLLQTESH